jgi:hypothetical protein
MAKPKPGGKRDKRLTANRPKTGKGSQGGKVPRRRPRQSGESPSGVVITVLVIVVLFLIVVWLLQRT